MSDAREAVAEAMAQTRQLAARLLMQKDELEAELVRRKKDRAGLDAQVSADAASLATDLDARIATLTTDLLRVKAELGSAVAEMKELHRLEGTALSNEVKAIVAAIEGDPVIRTAEQTALDNVRDHAKDLDAQVRLGRELGELPTDPVGLPAVPPPKAEDADAEARARFEELRAKPKTPKKTL
jgi:hypothetical protein